MQDRSVDSSPKPWPEPRLLDQPPEVAIDRFQEFLEVAARGLQRSSLDMPARAERALAVLDCLHASVGAYLRSHETDLARCIGPGQSPDEIISTPLPLSDRSEPRGKRCLALYQPQAWVADQAIDIDGARHFDVTEQVLGLGREEALKLRDNRDESDMLAAEAGLLGNHIGPYHVECEEAIREFFGVNADQESSDRASARDFSAK